MRAHLMIMRQIEVGEAIQTGPGASDLLEEMIVLQMVLVDRRSWVVFEP